MTAHFRKSHLPDRLTPWFCLYEAMLKTQGLKFKFWLFAFVIAIIILAESLLLSLFIGGSNVSFKHSVLGQLIIEFIFTSSCVPIIAGLFALAITAVHGISIINISLTRYFNRMIWRKLIIYRLCVMTIREISLLIPLMLFSHDAATQSLTLWPLRLIFEACFVLTIPFIVHNKFSLFRSMACGLWYTLKNMLTLAVTLAILMLPLFMYYHLMPAPYRWWAMALSLIWLAPMMVTTYALVYMQAQDSIAIRNP